MALWREALLAKKVLEGKTSGYQNHSQLLRFRASGDPLGLINRYLSFVLEEAKKRGYRFDSGKVKWEYCWDCRIFLEVSSGQVNYERRHLLSKLEIRDFSKYEQFSKEPYFELHPVFSLVEGEIEEWEKISGR